MKNKRGQFQSGLVTGLVYGIAGLVIAFIIAFALISTITNSESLFSSNLNTTINESQNYTVHAVYANGSTPYRMRAETGGTYYHPRNYIITTALAYQPSAGEYQTINATYRDTILSIDDDGYLTNTTAVNATFYSNLSLTYTNLYDSNVEGGVARLEENFTEGADNISEQIPTLLLIAAVVLILGVVAVLVALWRRMNFGGSAL